VGNQSTFDLDASAFLLNKEGKIQSVNDIIYYNQMSLHQQAIQLNKDNKTGAGSGDDEEIIVNLRNIPSTIEKIVIAVSIHEAEKKSQSFGQVNNSYVRIIDQSSKQEMIVYQLGKEFSNESAITPLKQRRSLLKVLLLKLAYLR
jgi:stress response protein SCP2